MYQRLPSWVLGFHGTDEETVNTILNNKAVDVQISRNPYDWLGDGAYFWENDPVRALAFAKERMKWKGIVDKKPAVIGAVIDLGFCMNLFDQEALIELSVAYKDLEADSVLDGFEMPVNKGKTQDLLYRYLDRRVFEQVHALRAIGGAEEYQTVRAPFMEGDFLYTNTLFRQKNHIQIAVRDLSCIRGYFLPRGDWDA